MRRDGAAELEAGNVVRDDPPHFLHASDVWDPATMEFSPGDELAEPRGFHTATLLPDGRVLIAGGDGASGIRALAEVWDPAAASTDE
jgi:hypothetical protein